MSNRSRKHYKKLKKMGVVRAIILFVLFSILSAAMVIAAALLFGEYILQSKIQSEKKLICYMADMYNDGLTGKEDSFDRLNKTGYDYIIRDKKGNVIQKKGQDTCTSKGGIMRMSGDSFMVYTDKEVDYLEVGEYNSVSLDLEKLYKAFRKEMNEKGDEIDIDVNVSDSDVDVSFVDNYELEKKVADTKILKMPIWISFDVKNGTEEFLAKAIIEIKLDDAYMFLGVLGCIGLLIAIVLLTMLIGAIIRVVNQTRNLNMFMTDDATLGHNWMWLLIKGENVLHRKSSEKNKFAVVNLYFLNYNNYCICHSVSEGNEILKRIYGEIQRNMFKYEMCSHVNTANFGMLLRYDDEIHLKARLQEMISSLENIAEEHQFAFQAGVSLVNQPIDEDTPPVKKKDISIEYEYNNACAARMSLADTDESGVAFFGLKLVEDQKWLDWVQHKQDQAVRNEEFMVYYQPKYDPKTNELRGAEALIRWESPENGFITPNRFIPIFEKNGFITEIDHYMLIHVARDQKRWLDKGYKCVPVSVNVSRAHFIESDLAEQIRDMVDSAGTPHDLIEIELTESAFFDDKKAMLETIKRLKSYGFSVSMDDFGAGYSSLNSLKDMPLDVLKLDADFFRGDSDDGRGEIVVSEAIKLAKNLNMRIVAEGVEVKEQVDFLATEGCDMIQGYYYAKPMPSGDYEGRMQKS